MRCFVFCRALATGGALRSSLTRSELERTCLTLRCGRTVGCTRSRLVTGSACGAFDARVIRGRPALERLRYVVEKTHPRLTHGLGVRDADAFDLGRAGVEADSKHAPAVLARVEQRWGCRGRRRVARARARLELRLHRRVAQHPEAALNLAELRMLRHVEQSQRFARYRLVRKVGHLWRRPADARADIRGRARRVDIRRAGVDLAGWISAAAPAAASLRTWRAHAANVHGHAFAAAASHRSHSSFEAERGRRGEVCFPRFPRRRIMSGVLRERCTARHRRCSRERCTARILRASTC